MGKVYLFSPIGNTDPIKYFRDGSMLHICRVYQPDVVYFYLSKEMYENHLKDNRYVRTLELLGEKLNHKFEVHLIVRDDLTEVQRYDMFYQEFREQISQIEEIMNPEDQLLLNMASGTPGMKSALVVMATLAEYRFLPIQVSSPKKQSNLEYEERDGYDVIENWELDQDNEPGFDNRCEEVKCMNLVRLLKIDIVKKHLLSYDYHAAYAIARDIYPELEKKTLNLLEAADARINLNWSNYALKNLKKKEFCPIEQAGKRKIFEYALGLKIKLAKGEYADFVRAITPLVIDLLGLCLLRFCHIRLSDYTYRDKQGVTKWDEKALNKTEIEKILQSTYNGKFNYNIVYSSHLKHIIDKLSRDKIVIEYVKRLRHVEEHIRNMAAHEIISVTEERIKKETGYTSAEIMNCIQNLCEKLKIVENIENWNSYDNMNEYIIQHLEKDSL